VAGNAQNQPFWYTSFAHKRTSCTLVKSNKELEGVCMGFSSVTFWHSLQDSAYERKCQHLNEGKTNAALCYSILSSHIQIILVFPVFKKTNSIPFSSFLHRAKGKENKIKGKHAQQQIGRFRIISCPSNVNILYGNWSFL